MKNLISILLIFLSTACYSQTSLDYEVLNKVNNYRKSLNLQELKIDVNLQKGAEHHSNYLLLANIDVLKMVQKAIHENSMNTNQQAEVNIIRGHEEKGTTFDKRASQYGIYKENVVTLFGTMYVSTYAAEMVDTWKKSPSHHQTMVDPKMKYCGISTKIFEIDNKQIVMRNVYIVSTMTFK